MATYQTPGVYIEEVELGAKPIAGVGTSVAGFVGAVGLSNVLPNKTELPTNGDIVKLADLKSKFDQALTAQTAKKYNELIERVNEMDEIVLAIESDIKSLDETKKAKALKDLLTIKEQVKISKEVAQFFKYLHKPTLVTSWGDFTSKFGYYTKSAPYLAPAAFSFFLNGGTTAFIVITKDNKDASIKGTDGGPGARTGLEALTDIDEVTIVMAPGITAPAVLSALIAHCERMKDRIAILDAPEETTSPTAFTDASTGYAQKTISADGYAALYTPWYKSAVEYIDSADNNKLKSQQIFIPPSGAMAGIFSRSDSQRGVYKAPANEQVRGALELKVNYNKAEQALLNPEGINCIRAFPGRGILVWGARTTASNALWKYVNVRRLFMFLEESIDEGTQWVVFEPNDEKLWARVKQSISNFLTTQWREGALMGSTPDEAFFVKCDRETMTDAQINSGQLICEIGVCPVKPAEFVIFRIAQQCTASA